jgi:hypothetical protein
MKPTLGSNSLAGFARRLFHHASTPWGAKQPCHVRLGRTVDVADELREVVAVVVAVDVALVVGLDVTVVVCDDVALVVGDVLAVDDNDVVPVEVKVTDTDDVAEVVCVEVTVLVPVVVCENVALVVADVVTLVSWQLLNSSPAW